MKKVFAKKKATTIKESVVNKAGNVKNATVIRIADDKAIRADKDTVKKIQKLLIKDPDMEMGQIISKIGGERGEHFSIIDVEKEKRDFKKIAFIDAKSLRITDDKVIRGPAYLVKKVYDYLQDHPDAVGNPEKLVKKLDEPITVAVDAVVEREKIVSDGAMFLDAESDDEEEVTTRRTTEKVPQLLIYDEKVADDEIINTEYVDFIAKMDMRHKYDALGALLEMSTFKGVVENARVKREQIAKEIDVNFPRSTTQPGFVDYSRRKPAFSTKFNPFVDTVTVVDTMGKTTTRRKTSKLQGNLDTATKIDTWLLNVESPVTFDLREYVRSAFYDLVKTKEAPVVEEVAESETEYISAMSHKQFFMSEYNKLVAQNPDKMTSDSEGEFRNAEFERLKKSYTDSQYNIDAIDEYLNEYEKMVRGDIKESRSKEFESLKDKYAHASTNKSAVLDLMTRLVAVEFSHLYTGAYALMPFSIGSHNFPGFLKSLGNSKRTTKFEVNFMKHLQKNISHLLSPTDGERLTRDFNAGLFPVYGMDPVILKEIKLYLSNHLDEDFKEFFVFDKVLMLTQEQIQEIASKYEEYKRGLVVPRVSREDVVEKVDEKDTTLEHLIELEDMIYTGLGNSTISEYIFEMSRFMQIWSVEKTTVGPWCHTLKRRLAHGQITLKDLYNMDDRLKYADFYMNPALDVAKFNAFLAYSQYQVANEMLNTWVYTKTYKYSEESWYPTPSSVKFDPSLNVVNTLCGEPSNVVYVLEKGSVVCKNVTDVAENISQYTKANSSQIASIVSK